jgi:hypothetical protein
VDELRRRGGEAREKEELFFQSSETTVNTLRRHSMTGSRTSTLLRIT